VKGIGVPLPVPLDVLVLAAATGSASGKLVLWQAFLAILFGMVGGGFVQFLLVRGPARGLLYRVGGRVGLTQHRLDLALQRVNNVGVIGVAVAVVTPGIRTAAIPACGLTQIRARIFAIGLAIGSTCYLAVQFLLVYGAITFFLHIWLTRASAWDWFLLIPLAAVVGALVYRHRTAHLSILHGSLREEDDELRSHWCVFCRITAVADSLAHRDGDASATTQTPPNLAPTESR
jgi:membrane protein DedA with SNARE-associated domain